MIHTLNIFSYMFATVNSNEITLKMSVSNREAIYTHAERFGATGYNSESNRKAKGLLTSADNGEHTENFLGQTAASRSEGFPTFQELAPSPSSGCC
jgi:hypothetical protein